MKNYFILLLAAFTMSLPAQTNTATPDYDATPVLQTPESLTSKFNSDYPNNNPTWSSDGPYFRADYNDMNTKNSSYVTYDKDGNVVMRGYQVPAGQYPNALTEFYTTTYPNENYDVWSSKDDSGKATYYVNRTDETVWFDSNGKYKNTTKTKAKSKSKKTTTNKNKK